MTSYWTGKKREDMMGIKNPMYKPRIKKICECCEKIFYVCPCFNRIHCCSHICKIKLQTFVLY